MQEKYGHKKNMAFSKRKTLDNLIIRVILGKNQTSLVWQVQGSVQQEEDNCSRNSQLQQVAVNT